MEEEMSRDEMINNEINYYVNLLRIKGCEIAENKELDYTKHNEENIDNTIMMAYIEMFCDWASFGLKQDNPREVRSWYINEKPKMTLFPAEQEVLEDILEEYISKFPEEEE